MSDLLGVVASGFRVYQPSPALQYARFARVAGGTLSNDDRTLAHTSGDWAQCLTTAPVTGKTYLEYLVNLNDDDPYGGFGCYGGTNPAMPDSSNLLGQTWGEPGGSWVTSEWTDLWFANYGLPEYAEDARGALVTGIPRTDRLRIAADGRRFWIAVGAETWIGGGDPVAGTSPTLTLAGTADVYAGASFGGGGSVTMLLPGDYLYSPPAGFTPGIIVPP